AGGGRGGQAERPVGPAAGTQGRVPRPDRRPAASVRLTGRHAARPPGRPGARAVGARRAGRADPRGAHHLWLRASRPPHLLRRARAWYAGGPDAVPVARCRVPRSAEATGRWCQTVRTPGGERRSSALPGRRGVSEENEVFRVLIADDVQDLRSMLRLALELSG